ncbi:hypothetical protein HKX48_001825 [Thoreauomyces humboldtii]|nr:hypothetical protein HKX48_001825 [Thoreauomyces humboldtii]
MSRHRNTTLFVSGLGPHTRAKDLAYEFERFGTLLRCDIPAPRGSSAKPFAFVEFQDDRDAEDAYYDMQNRKIDGYMLNIQVGDEAPGNLVQKKSEPNAGALFQWAKNAPSRSWRYDGEDRDRSPPRGGRGGPRDDSRRRRSRSPPRGGPARDSRRSRSPVRRDVDDRKPATTNSVKEESHHHSSKRSPSPGIKRSPSPIRRSPSPVGNGHRSPSASPKRVRSRSPAE